MKDLKLILFEQVTKFREEYIQADKLLSEYADLDGFAGLKTIRHDRWQRFSTVWDMVEAAGLEAEYEAWSENKFTGDS